MSASLFHLLSKEEFDVLYSQSHKIELIGGDCLFEKGDFADHIYLVDRGKITLHRLMPNGEKKVFKEFLAGGLIAEMAIFMNPRIYPMSANADQATRLTCFSYRSITELLKISPELSLKFMGFMGNRVFNLMNTIDILTQVNANQRLVMRFAEIYTKQNKKNNRFMLPHTKRVLASQLGITPETLSRILNKFKKGGLIEESGGCITVPNFNLLCHEVDLLPGIFS